MLSLADHVHIVTDHKNRRDAVQLFQIAHQLPYGIRI